MGAEDGHNGEEAKLVNDIEEFLADRSAEQPDTAETPDSVEEMVWKLDWTGTAIRLKEAGIDMPLASDGSETADEVCDKLELEMDMQQRGDPEADKIWRNNLIKTEWLHVARKISHATFTGDEDDYADALVELETNPHLPNEDLVTAMTVFNEILKERTITIPSELITEKLLDAVTENALNDDATKRLRLTMLHIEGLFRDTYKHHDDWESFISAITQHEKIRFFKDLPKFTGDEEFHRNLQDAMDASELRAREVAIRIGLPHDKVDSLFDTLR